jgi:hypothetical protein
MEENQRGSLYGNLHRFGEGHIRKNYNLVCMLLHYYENVYPLKKVRNISISCLIMYVTIFFVRTRIC